jgi:predicted transcriptional regulator
MQELKTIRREIRLSLSSLARQAAVSRFRLYEAEAGALVLTPEEVARIKNALEAEGARLASVFRILASTAN